MPKGDTDVRVVYDGTSSGLNETLWAPNFYLPSSHAASLLLTFSTWLADMDFGEMFSNFHSPEIIRRCSGIDVSNIPISSSLPIFRNRQGRSVLRWSRLFMGLRSSPYNAVRYYYWGEEFARGNPFEVDTNPMGYDQIKLNLPGMETYDPTMPKLMKWNSRALDGVGTIAGDVITFVDDVRISGHSKENCHLVHRQFTSRIQYLGMQDARGSGHPRNAMLVLGQVQSSR